MIKKIMKAVKRGNKKRSINITIGAVVGFLLSCTAVMGAEDNYLWINEDGGAIKFSIDGSTTIGKEHWLLDNPYTENTWDADTKTYTNNMILSSSEDNGIGGSHGENVSYGFKLTGDLSRFNFINNGSIAAGGGSKYCYAIYNYEDTIINTLLNNGVITGESKNYNYGISSDVDSRIETLTNNGVIAIEGTGAGIHNSAGSIGTLINNGLIAGRDYTNYNNGINNGILNGGSIEEILINRGLIIGTGDNSAGIYNNDRIETLTNTGTIYGKDWAVTNDGSINSAYNYGITANGTEGEPVIYRVKVINAAFDVNNEDIVMSDNPILNRGLIFTVLGEEEYKVEEDYNQFGTIHKDKELIAGYEKNNDGTLNLNNPIKESYTVINAKEKEGSSKSNITGTESLSLDKGVLTCGNSEKINISSDKKYILNGITDTLKVAGTGNELNNSAVNAYKTAVVMDKDMSTLTLNDTTVSGGVLDGSAVNISGNGNTLAVQGNSTINSNATAITVGGNNNAVTLEGNARVNGKMESTGNNTLNLNGNAEYGMNMLHNISGFVNMNIENNVTFFENIEVTGTDTVTVDKNGVLSLRLKKDETTKVSEIHPKGIHAFSKNGGVLIKGASTDEAGTLNFITNGIGREIIVENIELENMKIKTNSIIDSAKIYDDYIHLGAGSDLSGIVNPRVSKYDSLNKIYKSVYSSREENIEALRNILAMTFIGKHYGYNNATDEEQLKTLMSYLNSIYTETPYSYSSELSRRSMGMFRDIVAENHFRPELNKWMIMGGLTHADGGTKDSYYGQNYHGIDMGTAETDVDMKLTGAYALGKYGYSENVSLGVAVGGNRSEAEMSMSKVKGNSGYIGAFAENYRGNLTLKAGAGIQYSEYDADRATLGGHSYDEKYSDMAYDIYLNGRYSHNIGDNLFLEPYGTLSYTYVDQDSADEGSKALAIETDSKSFDYTSAKVGVDLKKVIPHEKGKSTLSAGVSYTRLLNGVDEEYITGRFKGENTSDFDILVAHKNEHSLGLNAKYTLELENGVLLDVKGSYAVERDSHNGAGKNKTKGEWIVGAGLGYKF